MASDVEEEAGRGGFWTRPTLKKDLDRMAFVATGARLFSTCSRRQYMAIIYAPNGRIVGTGYNGGPPKTKHCNEGGCERAKRAPEDRDDSYADCIAIHAEANAITWSDSWARIGGTLVVNGEPCFMCAKLIIGAGITEVVYLDEDGFRGTGLDYLGANGVTLVPVNPAAVAEMLG